MHVKTHLDKAGNCSLGLFRQTLKLSRSAFYDRYNKYHLTLYYKNPECHLLLSFGVQIYVAFDRVNLMNYKHPPEVAKSSAFRTEPWR